MLLLAEHEAAKLQTMKDNEHKKLVATAQAEVERISLQAKLENAQLECKRRSLLAEADANRVRVMDAAALQGINPAQLDPSLILSFRLSQYLFSKLRFQ